MSRLALLLFLLLALPGCRRFGVFGRTDWRDPHRAEYRAGIKGESDRADVMLGAVLETNIGGSGKDQETRGGFLAEVTYWFGDK